MQNWCLKVEWRQPKPGNLLLDTRRVMDNLPNGLILTQTNLMRSKPVRFWSIEAGYAELIFEGEMKTANAWQPTVSSLPVGILTIFQSRAFWRKPIKWDQSLYVSEVLSQDMQNWCLKVEWRQPKPGNLLWARYLWGFWQSSNRAHFDANQSNEIKACTFLKCWARICRIDVWRWNEDSQSLATYCELATQTNLRHVFWQSSNRAHFDANQSNEIKACTFLKCWARICRIDVWRWNEDSQSLATYCELDTRRVIDNLPIGLILTQTNQMRSKPVRFWSVEPGYAELMFEGGMKTAKAWQPTVSWKRVDWLTIFQSGSFWRKLI